MKIASGIGNPFSFGPGAVLLRNPYNKMVDFLHGEPLYLGFKIVPMGVSTMKKILILDDDIELCELLTEFFASENCVTKVFHRAQDLLNEDLDALGDLLILDIMLPEISGFDVLKTIRTKFAIPVIMLTARGGELDRVLGLELGADDYLHKPFSSRELMARIRAIFRRMNSRNGAQKVEEILHIGDVKLHTKSRQMFLGEREVGLTTIEFKLLELLMRSPGKALDRQYLTAQALDRNLSSLDRSLDVHISNLRRKLGNQNQNAVRIQTVWGVGYILVPLKKEED